MKIKNMVSCDSYYDRNDLKGLSLSPHNDKWRQKYTNYLHVKLNNISRTTVVLLWSFPDHDIVIWSSSPPPPQNCFAKPTIFAANNSLPEIPFENNTLMTDAGEEKVEVKLDFKKYCDISFLCLKVITTLL